MRINNFSDLQQLSDNDRLLAWSEDEQIVGLITLGDLKAYIASGTYSNPKYIFSSPGDGNGILRKRPELFTISASSSLNDFNFFPVSVLVDGSESSWASQNVTNSYVLIVFSAPLKLSRYTLRGHTNNEQDQPRSWKLEGRNTGAYNIIEEINNNNSLNQGTWYTSNSFVANEAFTEYKLTMTGVGNTGRNFFCLSEIDFYGEVL